MPQNVPPQGVDMDILSSLQTILPQQAVIAPQPPSEEELKKQALINQFLTRKADKDVLGKILSSVRG